MATDIQANNYIKSIYKKVWQPYSAHEYVKYYDKKLIARSGDRIFHFEEFYHLLENNENTLSYMRPEFHQVVADGDNQLVAWFTTIHHYANGREAYRINTMSNYTIKDNKIVAIDFMWDKSIEFVMNFAKLPKVPKISSLVTRKTLSAREAECFFHIIQSCSIKEIALRMNISKRTVETHLSNIKDKLDVSNLREIIEFALANGYISVAPLFNAMLNEI